MASNVLRNIGREVRGLDRTVGRGMSNLGRNLERGITIGATAAVGGLVAAVHEAANFEASLNTINTVARLNEEQLTAVGEGMRKIARDTGTDLNELTTGYYDLVSAGIAAAQAQDVLEASNRLAIGGLASTAETVDLITTALNSYGVAAENQGTEAARFADIFAKAIERGKVTAAEISTSFANIGPLAANMGIEIEELAAAYAQLTAKGETGASASTAMAAAMIALQRTTGPMEKLQNKLNVSFSEMAGEKGLAATWALIAEEADKAGIPLIEYTGRQEALAYVLGVTGDSQEGYIANLEAMGAAEGTAAAQMSEREKGLVHQLNLLKANVKDAGLEIGDALLPQLTPIASTAVGWLVAHREDIKGFGKDLAAGLREAGAWLTRIDWGAITNTLRGLGGIGKGMLDAFLAMPSWVQIAVVSGWGLNKLTGGAVGSIFGSVIAGVGKAVLQKLGLMTVQAGVVNINAASVRGGPGGGIGGAAGRGGGFLGGASRLLGGALAVGGGAAIGWQIAGPEFQRQVDAGRGQLETGRSNLLATGNRHELERALGNLDASIEELSDGLSPEELAYAFDIGGVKTELTETREAIATRLDAVKQQEAYSGASMSTAMREGSAATFSIWRDEGQQARNTMANTTREVAATQRSEGAMDRAVMGTIAAIAAGISGKTSALLSKSSTVNVTVPVNIVIPISAAIMQQRLNEVRKSIGGGGFL